MVRLSEHKHQTENKAIEILSPPERVYIPVVQHLGKACNPLVVVGDQVFLGQKIAAVDAHVYSPIHASVSGKVAAIQEWPHPSLGRCKTIVIENDGQDKSRILPPSDINKGGIPPVIKSPGGTNPKSQAEVDSLTCDQIRKIVLEAGIVGMGGASFPSHIKLNPPKPLDTLIVNGAECEPYLTCDYRLMVEKTQEIIKGIGILARCVGVKKVYIAIEDNKPEAIKAFGCQSVKDPGYQVVVLRSAYPQGGEKQLIKNVLGKEVPQGKLPFDIGVLVHNVGTVLAVYEAAYLNKPLYERVVTVTGSCVQNPKNLLVRIGTPIKELIGRCGPLLQEPAKIIVGGPMMGLAQFSEDVPVIKSTTGVLLFNKKESQAQEEQFCIRCGSCIRECPVGLMPTLINLSSQKQMWQEAKDHGALDCIECGICGFVCPSNIRLVQSIKRAKLEAVK